MRECKNFENMEEGERGYYLKYVYNEHSTYTTSEGYKYTIIQDNEKHLKIAVITKKIVKNREKVDMIQSVGENQLKI